MLTWSWGLFCFSCCPTRELSGGAHGVGRGHSWGDWPQLPKEIFHTLPRHAEQWNMGRRGEVCQYWLEFSRLAVDEQLWDFCIICGGFVLFFFEEFCFSFYSTPFFLIKLCLSQPMSFCTFTLPVFSPSQWWMGSEPAAVWYLNCLLGLNHDITSVRLWRFIKMKSWKVWLIACWMLQVNMK